MRTLFALLLTIVALPVGAQTLGKPLQLKEPMSIQKLMATPDAYVGKTVQVKGKVTDVCQELGCWMELVDASSGAKVRIKVEDGVIVFPKDSAGKTAVAEGVFAKQVLTRDQAVAQAKQEAEETGRKFDPATIKSGGTFYQVQGTGAVLAN